MIKWLFKDRTFGSVYGVGLSLILGFVLGATNASWLMWLITLPIHIITSFILERKYG